MSDQSKNWIFTINNPTSDDLGNCRLNPPFEGIRYLAFEEEVGGKTGTPHLQGYLVLDKKRRLGGVSALPPMKRARLEVMKGNLAQNEVYCSKEGKLEQYGTPPKCPASGGDMEKERYALALVAAKEGRIEDIPADLYTRHYKLYDRELAKAVVEPAPLTVLNNLWIYGPSAKGKSRAILEEYPGVTYIKDASNKWWDGYNPDKHTVVVIDDIAPKHAYQMSHLKNWMDHRAFPAEFKGGVMLIRPERLFVTSNHSIAQVFADPKECTDADRTALARRFSVIDCNGPYPVRIDPEPYANSHCQVAAIRALLRNELLPNDPVPPLKTGPLWKTGISTSHNELSSAHKKPYVIIPEEGLLSVDPLKALYLQTTEEKPWKDVFI